MAEQVLRTRQAVADLLQEDHCKYLLYVRNSFQLVGLVHHVILMNTVKAFNCSQKIFSSYVIYLFICMLSTSFIQDWLTLANSFVLQWIDWSVGMDIALSVAGKYGSVQCKLLTNTAVFW